MKAILKTIFAIAVGLVCFTAYAQDNDLSIEIMGPGLHKLETIHPDGTMQRYMINIPKTYDGTQAVPLILGLHYGYERNNDNPERPVAFIGNEYYSKLYQEAFKPLNAIFVAPDSINGRWNTPENEAAVLRLMDAVIAGYNIDPKKTIVTGFSMGAFGTWYMASQHQDRFAAALPIAGIPADMATFRQNMKFIDIDWKIPLYIMHSRVDEVVPFQPTETYVKQLKEQDKDVTFHIIDDLSHHETVKYAEPVKQMVPWIENVWRNIGAN